VAKFYNEHMLIYLLLHIKRSQIREEKVSADILCYRKCC